MAIPVLIIGKSGSGKSASLRNLNPEQTALINVLGKPLPFRGNFTQLVTDSYARIGEVIRRAARDITVIDDAGYLISNMFMRGHSSGGGNSVFSLYNQIGDCFWQMVEQIRKAPSQGRVYVIMHEDKSDVGDIKPHTIGKLLDEKVCLEGMFTICLRCVFTDGRHVFSSAPRATALTCRSRPWACSTRWRSTTILQPLTRQSVNTTALARPRASRPRNSRSNEQGRPSI